MGTPIQTLPISAAALREVDIMGVFRYANTYPTGFDMAGKTKDDKGNLVIKVVLETGEEKANL
jgi:L-iditol 2-dehydrogenase